MKPLKLLSGGLTPLILLSALVSGGAYFARSSAEKRAKEEQQQAQQTIATVPVTQSDFEVVVTTMGKVEAVKSQPVMCEVSGQVVRVITNGARVKKGDVILELDAKRIARQLRDRQNEYTDAKAKLEQRKRDLAADVRKAELALQQAEKDFAQFTAQQQADMTNRERQKAFDVDELTLTQERFERKKRQAEASLIRKEEVELATADIEARKYGLERETKDIDLATAKKDADTIDKQAAVTKAQADLERAKAAQEDEISNATMQLQIQEQQMARAKDQFSKAIIHAPAAGIVALESTGDRFGGGGTQRPISVGDMVWEQMKVATIPDLSEMRVALELTQDQVRVVRKKHQATIQIEGLPGLVFHGEVAEIAQTATEQRIQGWFAPTGERVFQTYISIKNPKKVYLRPGTTAMLRITVDRLPRALSVPRECVFTREGETVVYVQHDGRFDQTKVELGPQNDDVVVVKKGLKPKDRIALHDVREIESEEGGAGKPAGSSPLPF